MGLGQIFGAVLQRLDSGMGFFDRVALLHLGELGLEVGDGRLGFLERRRDLLKVLRSGLGLSHRFTQRFFLAPGFFDEFLQIFRELREVIATF